MKKDIRVNSQINSTQVRVIDNNGQMLGILELKEAIAKAKQSNLDLVEVDAQKDPPVCKILDFKKFLYEAKKHLQEAKRNQKKHKIVLKEIKLKTNIAQGDLKIKLQRAKEFLTDYNKVKISLIFKGREIVHKDRGYILFNQIKEELQEYSVQTPQEPGIQLEGKQMMMILNPINKNKKKH